MSPAPLQVARDPADVPGVHAARLTLRMRSATVPEPMGLLVRIARRALVVGFALAMPISTSPSALAGGLAFGAWLHGHAHTVSLRGDAGHVDLILAHSPDDRPDCAPRTESVLVRAGCCGAPATLGGGHEDEARPHALHLSDEGPGLTPRGFVPATAAPTFAAALEPRLAPAEPSPLHTAARSSLRAASPALLRSVVLRV